MFSIWLDARRSPLAAISRELSHFLTLSYPCESSERLLLAAPHTNLEF
jgi:hypothetical protein